MTLGAKSVAQSSQDWVRARRMQCLLGFLWLTMCVSASCAQAEGPVAIVWDKEACTQCHMLISDKRFAAQVQTKKGEALNFDDVGCLVRYRQDNAAKIRALWFRNSRSDAWLSQTQARFVRSDTQTPMGYGFAAVDASVPNSLRLDQVQKALTEKSKAVAP